MRARGHGEQQPIEEIERFGNEEALVGGCAVVSLDEVVVEDGEGPELVVGDRVRTVMVDRRHRRRDRHCHRR